MTEPLPPTEVPYLGMAPYGAKCDHCYNPARYAASYAGGKWYGCGRHAARATRAANAARDQARVVHTPPSGTEDAIAVNGEPS